ncbi:MAG TPA: hypothetical protein VMV93_06315 [Chloroflexota bacterium]|nr:hypothetical protein [Chloroflexota bacterium]
MAAGIALFGVNVPFWDDWALVPALQRAAHGAVPWGELWAPQNQHRLVVPKLIMLGLAGLARWDVRVDMWLCFGLAIGTFCVVYWAIGPGAGRAARPRGGALALYVALFLFSAAAYDNWVWSWGIEWWLVALAAAGAVGVMTRWRASWLALLAGAALAATATYSFGAGMLVWAIATLALAALWRPLWRYLAVWCALAGAAIGLYFWGWTAPADMGFTLMHPLRAGLYVLVYLGSWARGPVYALALLALHGLAGLGGSADLIRFGGAFPTLPAWVAAAFAVLPALIGLSGLAVAAIIHVALWHGGRERLERWLPSLLLLYFGLLCAGLTALGRADEGVQEALASRYLTLSALFWIGLLVPGIELWRELGRCTSSGERRKAASGRGWPWLAGHKRAVAAIATIAFAGLYVPTYAGGVVGMYERAAGLRAAGQALQQVDTATDAQLSVLYPDAAFVRREAAVLRHLHLGPYG